MSMGRGSAQGSGVRSTRSPISAVLVATAAISFIAPAERALAQAAPEQVASVARTYNIPAGALADVLNRFAEASQLQLIYSGATTRGLRSPGVQGSYSPSQALAQVLGGSGLSYRYTGSRAVTIENPGEGAPPGAVPDGTVMLEAIDVSGQGRASGFQGTPDRVYESPTSTSVISSEAVRNNPGRDAKDLFGRVPGVLATGDAGQDPGLNVNIRGLQDQGRVVTTIDGARQNFQRNGHGGSSGNVYIDPAFVREIDIEKSATSGVGGAASLGGSVEFRTILAEDLILPGNAFGSEFIATTGTNAYEFAGSAAAAARVSDSFSVLGGISRIQLGEAEVGKNGTLRFLNGYLADVRTTPERDTWSGILKAEADLTDDVSMVLGWVGYTSDFSETVVLEQPQTATNNTFTSALDWDPESNLIELKTRLWYTDFKNEEFRPARAEYGDMDLEFTLATIGGSVENTSRFEPSFGSLAWTYGMEAFRDDGETIASGSEDPSVIWSFMGANPSGTRDLVSGFSNLALERDWLTVSGGLRYDHYGLAGTTTVFDGKTRTRDCLVWRRPPLAHLCQTWGPYVETYQTHEQDVDISGGALSPTATIAVTPLEGLQVFGNYGQAWRPPTIMEAVTGGSIHPKGEDYQIPNPNLVPEEAETFELGVNFVADNILKDGDAFRMKAVGFYREIENYIGVGQIAFVPQGSVVPEAYQSFVNLDGTTYMRGIELEANYDAGRYYVGGAFSFLDADWGSTYTYNGASYETGQFILFVPPRTKIALDAGWRFFDQKLTAGARLTYVGVADQHLGFAQDQPALNLYQTKDYTLIDLYASYAVNETTKLRFAINNLTDIAYVPALGSDTYPAPGRTATVSLNLKF